MSYGCVADFRSISLNVGVRMYATFSSTSLPKAKLITYTSCVRYSSFTGLGSLNHKSGILRSSISPISQAKFVCRLRFTAIFVS